MGNSFRETARAVIEKTKQSQPEDIAEVVSDTYPDITIEDATRIRDGLTAVMRAGTPAELDRLKREYKALHTELRKKYRKSGKQ